MMAIGTSMVGALDSAIALAWGRRSLLFTKRRDFGVGLELGPVALSLGVACFASFLAFPFSRGAVAAAAVCFMSGTRCSHVNINLISQDCRSKLV